MKPLVYWCRWHEATLRLHGRTSGEIWGEMVFAAEAKSFRFNLNTWELVLGTGETVQVFQLDEMGVVIDK